MLTIYLYWIKGILRGWAIQSGRRPSVAGQTAGLPRPLTSQDVCLTVSRNHAVFQFYGSYHFIMLFADILYRWHVELRVLAAPCLLIHWGMNKMTKFRTYFIHIFQWNFCILIWISLKNFPKSPNGNMPALTSHHQPLSYCLCRISTSLSYTRNDFNYLPHFSVENFCFQSIFKLQK